MSSEHAEFSENEMIVLYRYPLHGVVSINEILLYIFDYLDMQSLLSVSRVSHAWKERCDQSPMWGHEIGLSSRLAFLNRILAIDAARQRQIEIVHELKHAVDIDISWMTFWTILFVSCTLLLNYFVLGMALFASWRIGYYFVETSNTGEFGALSFFGVGLGNTLMQLVCCGLFFLSCRSLDTHLHTRDALIRVGRGHFKAAEKYGFFTMFCVMFVYAVCVPI
eukprot:PhF_6_TR25119/c0_g1_i2/m.34547